MRLLGGVAVCFLVVGAAIGVGDHLAGAKGATDCTVRTAWSGVESTTQQNGDLLEQFPAAQPITVRQVDVSGSYTGSGFAELLVLVGASDVPLAYDPRSLVPDTDADGSFASSQVVSTSAWNGQPSLQSGVLAARIVKGPSGSVDLTASPDVSVPAGGVLWLFAGTVGQVPLDPEAQLVVSYTPAGCP